MDYRLIEDYKLEAILRCPYRFFKQRDEAACRSGMNWMQLVQYTVSHTVNDYYMLAAERRKACCIKSLVERRWTNRVYEFHSMEHFITVKGKLIRVLERFLKESDREAVPLMLFEQWQTPVPALQMELSMIFQAVFPYGEPRPQSYRIQKFVVHDNMEAIQAFFHMVIVFFHQALSVVPGIIEVISVSKERRFTFCPAESMVSASYDYLRLIRDFLPEAETVRKCSMEEECKSCPFRADCRFGNEERNAAKLLM